jgi:two-component system KDP operon response regulator KdpE
MAERILLVDDEPAIHRFMAPALAANGYEVLRADTGTDALRQATLMKPDLVILDLGLPDMDGREVLERLRRTSAVPIIILSARDREAEKVAALDLGADDFVNKPFGMAELMARIRATLRHRILAAGETPVLSIGGIEIDVLKHRVTRDGVEVRLTPREFDLLAFLVRHAGKVVTHQQILAAVWGPGHREDTQYLRVYVRQLRAKLEDAAAAPSLIVTEPGIGYRFG